MIFALPSYNHNIKPVSAVLTLRRRRNRTADYDVILIVTLGKKVLKEIFTMYGLIIQNMVEYIRKNSVVNLYNPRKYYSVP